MNKNGLIFILLILLCSCDIDSPKTIENNVISRNNPGVIEDLKPADLSIARRICNSYISKKNKMEQLLDGELSLSYDIYDFACNDEDYNYRGNLSANLRVPLNSNVYLES